MVIVELVVCELVCIGGLCCVVVVVVMSIGIGWINEVEVFVLEYMYNGDIVIVSM